VIKATRSSSNFCLVTQRQRTEARDPLSTHERDAFGPTPVRLTGSRREPLHFPQCAARSACQRIRVLPEEILVSSTVKELVAGSDIALRDYGEHILKGVPDRWHLFAVES
jgi:hypothetical protein